MLLDLGLIIENLLVILDKMWGSSHLSGQDYTSIYSLNHNETNYAIQKINCKVSLFLYFLRNVVLTISCYTLILRLTMGFSNFLNTSELGTSMGD